MRGISLASPLGLGMTGGTRSSCGDKSIKNTYVMEGSHAIYQMETEVQLGVGLVGDGSRQSQCDIRGST